MNNKDYNEYMLNLYKECTFKVVSFSPEGQVQLNNKKVDELFSKVSSAFNNSMAIDFLTNISNKNPTIIDKLSSFPSSFWKTPESSDQITLGMQNFTKKYLTEIDKEIKTLTDDLQNINDQNINDVQFKEKLTLHKYTKFNNEMVDSGYNKEGTLLYFLKNIYHINSAFPAKTEILTQSIKEVHQYLIKSLEQNNIDLSLVNLNRYYEKFEDLFKDLPYKEQLDNINLKKILKINNNTTTLKYK